jgi:RNA polymerase sigma factor (sigma-70 family)
MYPHDQKLIQPLKPFVSSALGNQIAEWGMITSIKKSVNKVVMLADTTAEEWSDLLIRVGAERDREAFTRLFQHYAPLLKGFLMKGSNIGHEQAEELAQETMIKVWRKANSFNRQKSSASTWIYTVARNCRIDWIRREMRRQRDVHADDLYEPGDENPSQISLVQLRNKRVVRDSIELLPQEQKEVISKIYFEGKTHSEVSEELSLPLGTVKSRIRLALKRLNVQLEADTEEVE